MSNLKKEAEALGIEVNARWTDETLQKKIDEAKADAVSADLKKQAEELGINVDGRWGDERIRQEIDAKLNEPSHERAGTAPDAGAAGHELQGRQPFGGKGDHDGDGKPGGTAPILAQTGAPVADDGTPLATEQTPKATKAKVELDVKTRLTITAEELNIEVDEDWDEDRLRAEIQMAREGRADLQVKGAVPPAEYGRVDYDEATRANKDPKVSYELLRDYWDEAGERIPAGTNVSLTDTEARRLGPDVLKVKNVFG